MEKLELLDDSHCFACGMDNPHGLRIEWTIEGMTMTAHFTPEKKYQGWKGILHGGIIATLLDEAMTRLACATCGGAVTAEMTVRFVKPAAIGSLLLIRGEIVDKKRNLVMMKASIHCGETLIAYSSGTAIKI